MIKALLLAAILTGCTTQVLPGTAEDPLCQDGLLIIEGPVSTIKATFQPVEGEDTRLAHLCDPPMRLLNSEEGCRRDEWCFIFLPQQEADVYTIDTTIVVTGEKVCPLHVSY